MAIVEDRICDLDARGSEEADNIANERELDRFIMTGMKTLMFCPSSSNFDGLIELLMYSTIPNDLCRFSLGFGE